MINAPAILIDTMEQAPPTFTLSTGDCSIRDLDHFVAIERKSADDLVGCLRGQQRKRFERELSRGRGLGCFALVIEADREALSVGNYCSKMIPKSVYQSLLAFSVRYSLAMFYCPSREYAARVNEPLLLKYVAEQKKRLRAVNRSKASAGNRTARS